METINVLVVGGDDYGYHDFDSIGKVFSSLLENAGFHGDVTDDSSYLCSDKIEKYDVVICYMNRARIPGDLEQGLLSHVIGDPWSATKRLKGCIGIHTAACAFPGLPAYQRMIGAKFLAHPEMGEEFYFRVKNPDHPVMKGVRDFTLVDELYLMEQYPPYEVLLSCDYRGFERPIAWVKPYGLGRIFYLSLGHGVEQLQNEYVSRMVVNAVSWSVTR